VVRAKGSFSTPQEDTSGRRTSAFAAEEAVMPVIGPITFALLSALSYGAGDFIGGRAATRLPTLVVLAVAQLAASVLAVALARGASAGPMTSPVLLFGGMAGVCQVAAVGLLYHGLAHGRITVVAPLSGVLSIAVPVALVGAVHGPPLVQGTGILLAGIAVGLVTYETAGKAASGSLGASIGYGTLSGCLFGLSDLALGSVASTAAAGAVMAARLIGASAVLLVVAIVYGKVILGSLLAPAAAARGLRSIERGVGSGHARPKRGGTGALVLALFAGAGDCLGHFCFAFSAAKGELSIAVATSALFPAVSVLLAIIVLKERINRSQAAGLGFSAGAVVLLAGA
jgi:drug/metabolite transporter (DMT)-like permease